jgi:hypothetical protein
MGRWYVVAVRNRHTRAHRAHRAVAAAFAVAILGLAGCGDSRSPHPALPREHVSACAKLAAAAPRLRPVLAGLHDGSINLATSEPARRQLLRFTGDVARWAAASGAIAVTSLFRHLRQLWRWPPALIPEVADRIRRDIATASAFCATAR